MNSIILLSVLGLGNLFLGFRRSNRLLLPVMMLILGVVLTVNFIDWNQGAQSFFNGMLTIDNFSVAFTGIVLLTALVLVPFSQKYVLDGEANLAEYYSLLLFSLVGAIMLVSYNHLLMLFLGIEILSVAMYVLAGSDKRNLRSNEAALKYFLMGAFFTGILLFGMALLYGATGTFELSQISAAVQNPVNASLTPMLYIGMLLMLIGIGFKVSAAPFHFWTPDVYEGTPTFFAAFMSTVVKTAGFAAFLKLLVQAFPAASAQGIWLPTLTAMCVLTLLIGNVGAVAQTSIKRMLAYSSISHAGYLLIALVAYNGQLEGASANGILFYSLAYSVATVAAFGVVKLVADARMREDYNGLNGLAKTNPLLAFSLTVSMLSLAGIPLTGGFFGKFFIFSAAVENGYIGLVVFAVVMSMVSIYYYLRPIIAMYMRDAEDETTATPVPVTTFQSGALLLLAALTVLLGVLPGLVAGVL
ncbi:NADH-quinone oxidoreductase subunit N [Hymenobacter lutimineralis]|uniref:NADH-quinone oxidoreductase subunit N n=1 Tax=Hymenobacter lutimineralis TaxID=2606448 RepID=A0A5D6V2X2_9BACT|nr:MULTISPECIES: NADH-quinone oxidoreductase subunit N [Hymenobacter]QIX62181.1 NADH-quinone oxidoreductase subunit N [Hymenobacter sp. BT18]TYZ10103.1 NADH-quinone oxidoreductase subunit N [Hymenobacter lutimineralis]